MSHSEYMVRDNVCEERMECICILSARSRVQTDSTFQRLAPVRRSTS
jgi:hypothetical protein